MDTRPIAPGIYLLTAICGIVDATCFLSLGGVFAEVMTGNLMFLAFSIGEGELVEKLPVYLVPLVSFTVGAILGGWTVLRPRTTRHRRSGFVMTGILVGLACAMCFAWQPTPDSSVSMVIVGTLAFAMGIQNALVLHYAVPDIATNVMTLTLVRLMANFSFVGGSNDRWRFRAGSIGVFFASALVGAALTTRNPALALLLATALYAVALVWLMTGRHEETQTV